MSALLEKRESWVGTATAVGANLFEERYTVREVLGEGGFGTVYRVLRNSDGEELAAKTIVRLDAAHPRAESEWADAKAEADTWRTLSSPFHPSILPLIECLESDARSLHLITELMACGELTDALFYLEMSEQGARLILVQIAAAIAHLHLHHMVAHRDVKPANVLCQSADPTEIGSCKLADFGVAARFERRLEPCWSDPCGSID